MSVISCLTVVGRYVEAVFSFQLVVQLLAFSQYKLSVSSSAIQQNDVERQVRSPFVHGVAAYLICQQIPQTDLVWRYLRNFKL